MKSPWLGWIQKLQAIAQNGLAYTKDPYDRRRFEELRGVAAEMMAAISDEPPDKVLERFGHEQGAATPKVDVRGVVMRDGEMLLVRERRNGLWTLPGGWADVGKSPSQAVANEVEEEAGYVVKPARILALYDRSKHGYAPHPDFIYKVFIQCEIIEQTDADDLETDGVGFFARDSLPRLFEAQVTQAHLHRMFELAQDVNRPPDFD